MDMHEYLAQYPEEVPVWLQKYNSGDKISFKDVMSSRIAYYPGFYEDGCMLKVGNMSHSVHSFIHLDYLNEYRNDIRQIRRLPGYTSIGHIDWKLEDILPNGFYKLNTNYKPRIDPTTFTKKHSPYYFTEVLERKEDKTDSFGAKRIALTVLCADGIDFYYQLFVREYQKRPGLFLLQDHCLGCNYDKFGKGGLLDRIMTQNECWPEYVICENDFGTHIWSGYNKLNGINPIIGGMHKNVRYLFKRKKNTHEEFIFK